MAELENKLRRALIKKEKLDKLTGVYTFSAKRTDGIELDNLRRIIFRNHETASCSTVWVKKNTSGMRDEVYNSLFSFILIDDSEWNGEKVNFLGDDYLGSFRVSITGRNDHIRVGDIEETDHSNNLRIISPKRDPIIFLPEDEEVDMILYVKKGGGDDVACFYPHRLVYVVPPSESSPNFRFVIKSRAIDPDEIMENALTLLSRVQ